MLQSCSQHAQRGDPVLTGSSPGASVQVERMAGGKKPRQELQRESVEQATGARVQMRPSRLHHGAVYSRCYYMV